MLLDQPDPQPAHRRIPGDARTDDAAADDEDVQGLFFQGAQRASALLSRSGLVIVCNLAIHFEPFSCLATRNRSPNSARPDTTKSGAGE